MRGSDITALGTTVQLTPNGSNHVPYTVSGIQNDTSGKFSEATLTGPTGKMLIVNRSNVHEFSVYQA